MNLSKSEAQQKIQELKSYVENLDKEPEMAKEPGWGYKAALTNEFLAQTMVLDGVKYHRHKHGGGWVSELAQVDETVWVGALAIVHNGVVKDQVVIHDGAAIDCDGLQDGVDANLSGSARVYGSAVVSGSARVYGSAVVSGSAWVYGSAVVSDSARVYGSAVVSDSAWVSGKGYLKKDTNKNIELKNWEIIE